MKLPLTVKESSVKDILKALDNGLTPIDNWQAKVFGPITTPGTADTEFTVNHNLGRIPTHYIWTVGVAAIVYDSQRANWTDSQMFLKCSVASVTIFLIVMSS